MNDLIQKTNQRIQWIVGIAVFLISFLVYFRTVAPTTSYWDCGEFIACSYILGVMHPPGAPLYLLIGRLLTMIPFVGDIGLRVNLFSVFISAATVFLTYLIIVQLIRRWRGEAKTLEDRLILFMSAAFGAIAFAFTDSQWFNAVEAEVYGFSMFFTAIVVWMALLWGENSEKEGSLLLIFFVFYLFGLATGVHLLNILAYPFVLLIAYFHHNQTVRRLLMLIFIQAAVPIVLYMLFFQFDPDKIRQYQEIIAHQAKAGSFMKWFGAIWVTATMVYIYIKDKKVFKAWWILPVVGVLGYSTYLLIYIRANLAPPINENDPSTMTAMMDYLARKQYGTEDMLLTFIHRNADFWGYQIHQMYTRYFAWQFIGKGVMMDARDRIIDVISFRGLYGIPFFVGLWGAIHHFQKDWKRALSVLVLFLLTGYAIIIYLNQPDPQPRERDYSYVGSFFAFALWIGIGMAGVIEQISEALKKKQTFKWIAVGLASVILFIAVPVNMFAFGFHEHDRSGNYVAYDYSYNILKTCEKDGILFTNGDNDTFPLWFLQEVEGIRRDIRVVNLSLLNTHWYIKQLRDFEPRIPLSIGNRAYSDESIERLYPMPWKTQKVQIPVPESIIEEIKANPGPDVDVSSLSTSITWDLEPTYKAGSYQMLRVQDLMILRILQAVRWKRPVYFAVTVSIDNKMGMDNYLRMDGLTFKVVPYKVKSINPDILKYHLLENYDYRGLDDPDVFFNVSIQKLLQNYRSAFLQLAAYYLEENQKEDAKLVLSEMNRLMPDTVIPYNDERSVLYYADIMRRAGIEVTLEEQLPKVIEGRYLSNRDKVWCANFMMHYFERYDLAVNTLKEVLEDTPNDPQVKMYLSQAYQLEGQYQESLQVLEELQMQYPGERSLETEIDKVRRMIAEDTSGQAIDNLIQ